MNTKRTYQPGQIYHVYNRGHDKEKIFFDTQDYNHYIKKMALYARECRIGIIAYCLMPNHVHICVKQGSEPGVSKFIQKLHLSYVKYHHLKYKVVGHLFQSRFGCERVDTDEYLIYLVQYIHANPKKIFKDVGHYPYSSLAEFVEDVNRGVCDAKKTFFKISKCSPLTHYKGVLNFKKRGLDLVE